MRRHLAYLWYVVRHKWFVFKASRVTGMSIWRALVHDMSKFLPDEWFPYSCTFYKSDGSKQYVETDDFNMAWLKHQHRNKHHWQYWVLTFDDGGSSPVEMPLKYIREMVADWIGAGLAITGRCEVEEWYGKNKDKMALTPRTRRCVETLITMATGSKL